MQRLRRKMQINSNTVFQHPLHVIKEAGAAASRRDNRAFILLLFKYLAFQFTKFLLTILREIFRYGHTNTRNNQVVQINKLPIHMVCQYLSKCSFPTTHKANYKYMLIQYFPKKLSA